MFGGEYAQAGADTFNTAATWWQNYKATDTAAKWRKNAIQTQANDLEKAGFNRVLAAGGPGAQSTVPHQNPMPSSRIGDVINSAQANRIKQTEVQNQNKQIDAVVKDTEAAALLKQKQAALVNAQAQSQMDVNSALKGKYDAEKEFTGGLMMKIPRELAEIQSRTLLNSATRNKELEETFREQMQNLPYKDHPKLMPWLDKVTELLGRIIGGVYVPLQPKWNGKFNTNRR